LIARFAVDVPAEFAVDVPAEPDRGSAPHGGILMHCLITPSKKLVG
jgi:hypothetical protein